MDTLSRKSITDAIVDFFREKIQSGELKPGDKLPSERKLIQQLGVSRFSLREGLARLSALGIITIYQGKGAYVNDEIKAQTLRDVLLPLYNKTDEKNFSELIEARIFLETTLAKKASQNRTDEDIVLLEKNITETKKALDDPVQFAKLDSEFHQIIAIIAENTFLWRMQELLHGAVDDFISENVQKISSRVDAVEDHEKILADIRNKEGSLVQEDMQKHISVCVKHFQELKKGAL